MQVNSRLSNIERWPMITRWSFNKPTNIWPISYDHSIIVRSLFKGHPRIIQWSFDDHSMIIRWWLHDHLIIIWWSTDAHSIIIQSSFNDNLMESSRRENGFWLAKSHAVLAGSTSGRWDLENLGVGDGDFAPARTHIRSRSPRLTASGR